MAAHQAPLFLGFSRQEYWSGLPFPSPMHACMLSRFSRVWLCVTLQTAALQAPLSAGFFRQEYWSGLPFPSPKRRFSSVQFSRSVVSDSLRSHDSQHARRPCPSQTPRVYSDSCPSSWWCHLAISSSVVPSPPAPNPSQHQGLFQWVNSSHEVAKVLEFQLQYQEKVSKW